MGSFVRWRASQQNGPTSLTLLVLRICRKISLATPLRRSVDHSTQRIFHFGLRVDNEDEWKAKIKKHDLKLYYGGKIAYPHSRSWYIRDPSDTRSKCPAPGVDPLGLAGTVNPCPAHTLGFGLRGESL